MISLRCCATFNHFAALIITAVLLLLPVHAGANVAPQQSSHPLFHLEVAPGDWGGVSPLQVKQLLDWVAADLIATVGLQETETLQLTILPRNNVPRVLYERGVDGQYLVHLTARGDRWYQYVYQFSHELCHVLSNYDHRELTNNAYNIRAADGNQWFEEALCETASLYTLRHLGAQWQQQPPSRNWAGYGRMLEAYAEHILQQPHRHAISDANMHEWFSENRQALTDSPYLRDRNEVVATHLLQLFESNPELWHAIVYLNQKKTVASESFEQYLQAWLEACPGTEQALVERTIELLGPGAGITEKARRESQAPLSSLAAML